MAVIVLIAVVAVLGPLALACWCVFCEIRAWGHGAHEDIDAVLTDQEAAELQRARQIVQGLEADIDHAFRRGFSQGFELRADGLFDARRPGARAANSLLSQLIRDRDGARWGLDAVQRRLDQRMLAWLNARTSLVGARAGLIVFIIAFIGVVAYSGASLTPEALLFGTGQDAGGRLAASLTAIGCALVAVFIGRSIARASLVG